MNTGLRAVLDAAVRQQAVDTARAANGVDAGELGSATAGAVATVDALDPPDTDSGQRTALAYIFMLLLFFQLLNAGIAVATGVVGGEDQPCRGASAVHDQAAAPADRQEPQPPRWSPGRKRSAAPPLR